VQDRERQIGYFSVGIEINQPRLALSDTLTDSLARLIATSKKPSRRQRAIHARVGFQSFPLPRNLSAKCGGCPSEKRLKISNL
jgi:hypothetical protein